MSRIVGQLPSVQMQGIIDAQALFEVQEHEANRHGLTSYQSLCTRYHGERSQPHNTIRKHLQLHGRNPFFLWPMVVWTFSNSCKF